MADSDYLYEPYRSTILGAPRLPLVLLPERFSERTGPVFGHDSVAESCSDLTRQHAGEPLGQRIIVTGRVCDEDGRPVTSTLVETSQTNAAGRYFHDKDRHDAPLDPNFTGWGRALTDSNGCSVEPGRVAGVDGTMHAPHINRQSTVRRSAREHAGSDARD